MEQSCKKCGKNFFITNEDQVFYQKVKVPHPTLCPDCRLQRRMSFRNERTLYTRTCDLCKKKMVSLYPQETEFTIYCHDCFWSDTWDSLKYGRDFDFSRPFFDQYEELFKEIPLVAFWGFDNENAEYNNACYKCKNCYMNVCTDKSEDSYYNYISCELKDGVDCTSLWEGELCYFCIDCEKLYRCIYCQRCRQSQNCSFCSDCIGCDHCFGCHGLRHKKYHLFNQELTKEEWEKKVEELIFTPRIITDLKKRSEETRLKMPQVHGMFVDTENCTGNYLWHCKNAIECFDCQKCEDIKYIVYTPFDTRDSYDCYAVGGIELAYEVLGGGIDSYNIQFINNVMSGISNSKYSTLCGNNCKNLFGCVSLKHQQYCIFNKQYTKEAYEKLVPKIIDYMKKTGEYGEFFPSKMSPFGYNETIAQEYFPLTKEAAVEQGFKWRDESEVVNLNKPYNIPQNINDVPDTIVSQILSCSSCGKNYKIIIQELKFYRKMKLPIPSKCPDCRHKERIALRNPRKLWDRKCQKCGKEIKTTYAPERQEIVYCESCYLGEVY